jgi:hypothetical protein
VSTRVSRAAVTGDVCCVLFVGRVSSLLSVLSGRREGGRAEQSRARGERRRTAEARGGGGGRKRHGTGKRVLEQSGWKCVRAFSLFVRVLCAASACWPAGGLAASAAGALAALPSPRRKGSSGGDEEASEGRPKEGRTKDRSAARA